MNIPFDTDGPLREVRREFLKKIAFATTAGLAYGAPKSIYADEVEHPEPTADSVILLWMAGGDGGS